MRGPGSSLLDIHPLATGGSEIDGDLLPRRGIDEALLGSLPTGAGPVGGEGFVVHALIGDTESENQAEPEQPDDDRQGPAAGDQSDQRKWQNNSGDEWKPGF